MIGKKVSIQNDGSRFTMMAGKVTRAIETPMGEMLEVVFEAPRYNIKSALFFASELVEV